MKFSDQEVGYFDPDENATVWLPLREYVEKFADRIGVRNAVPGTNNYRTFTLPHAIDISFNPHVKERAAYYAEKVAFVLTKRDEGVLLDAPNLAKAVVTIAIDWDN